MGRENINTSAFRMWQNTHNQIFLHYIISGGSKGGSDDNGPVIYIIVVVVAIVLLLCIAIAAGILFLIYNPSRRNKRNIRKASND